MKFTYFESPENYASFLDGKMVCDICGTETKCLDAGIFFGEDEIDAICLECLAGGGLKEMDIYTCNGDIGELKRQLRTMNSSLTNEEINTMAEARTRELQKTTPALATWQDWDWPCADGDYCIFIGYGSRPFYNRLAKDKNGETLFKNSIYQTQAEESHVAGLWNDMPGKNIPNYKESENWSLLFYVFKSLHSDTIITCWDMD